MPQNRIARASRRQRICCRVAFLLLSGLQLFPHAAGVLAQGAPVGQPAAERRFAAYIAEASQRFRIPEAWIRTVLDAESAHDVRAVSSAGAMGLMQVMPGTWAELRARHRLGNDPFDPRDNILAGAAYLREMLDRYGNVGGMLAAYNAGPARYDEYLATGRPLPAETRNYVAKLAPILGGRPLPRGTATAPRPTDWREAPVFIVPPADGSPEGSLQPDGGATDASAQSNDTTPSSSESIFVARSAAGAPQ
jgi:hypothetical protein